MSRQITIRPSGHVFQAQEGETVLEAALREGFMLPYGCRNGACGSCKGKVIEGAVDHGNFRDSVLPAAEQAAMNLLTAPMAIAGVILGMPGLMVFRMAASS